VKKPRRAIHFASGDVLVFNIYGEKILDMCGDWVDVHDAVVEASNEKTHFEWVDGAGQRHEQTAESW
jgi:hypothetical protein